MWRRITGQSCQHWAARLACLAPAVSRYRLWCPFATRTSSRGNLPTLSLVCRLSAVRRWVPTGVASSTICRHCVWQHAQPICAFYDASCEPSLQCLRVCSAAQICPWRAVSIQRMSPPHYRSMKVLAPKSHCHFLTRRRCVAFQTLSA